MEVTTRRAAVLVLFFFTPCLLLLSGTAEAAGTAQKPAIVDRAGWGARPPQGTISTLTGLNRAIIHHTANQNDYQTASLADSRAVVRATQNYHMDVNGWSDIGYHFLCDRLGNTFEGRAGSMSGLPRGAHDGTNSNSFGFNIMGYYHAPYNQKPTQASLDALAAVIAWRMPAGWEGPYGYPDCSYGTLGNCVGYIDSHRRVKPTGCPGDLIHLPYIGNDPATGVLRSMVRLQMHGPAASMKTGQRVRVETAGSGWQILAFSYTMGHNEVSPWQAGTGTASYDLPPGNWSGLFLYDYASGRFTQAVYSGRVPL